MHKLPPISIPLALILLLTQGILAFGQPGNMEDLSQLKPMDRVDTLNEWAWTEAESAPVRARSFARAALKESEAIAYAVGEGDAHNRLGRIAKLRGNFTIALEHYQSALSIRKTLEDDAGSAGVLRNLGNLYNETKDYTLAREAFREAMALDRSIDKDSKRFSHYNGIGIAWEEEGNADSARHYYELAGRVAKEEQSPSKLAELGINLGSLNYHQGDFEAAIQQLKPSLDYYQEVQDTSGWVDAVNNLAAVYTDRGQPQVALDSLLRPVLKDLGEDKNPQRLTVLYNTAEAHQALGNADSAYYYFKRYDTVNSNLYSQGKAETMAELNALYDLNEKQELDQENALLRSEGRRQTTLLTALAVIAILLVLMITIVYGASRRRIRLQRQSNARRQALDAQRIVELVQEQELRTLDALLEGQESERQRIASDLHDRLGGLMATVKLHFNALEPSILPEQHPFFNQADQMIDQTCTELRSISHDLAEGQVAAFGLLNSIQDLADSISGAGTLQVKVFAQNLEDPLSLAVERDVYKITQELLTNVIKHAQASQVSVQLIRHPKYLHLGVEDNGKGMDQVPKGEKGLGLRSIRGRVQAHGGTILFDSHATTGTSILIDLPI